MGNNKGMDIIRLLRADEIECRVAMMNEKGLSLLLYKDARVDQRILDETFGVFGWKRSHQCIGGNLYCTVEVYHDGMGEWVSKQDAGGAYAEKENLQASKSQASDSFKRACFNWGIGRELYTAPFIWVPSSKVEIRQKGDRFYCNEHFLVSSITYNEEREITGLVVVNGKNHVVYELKAQAADNAQKAGAAKQGAAKQDAVPKAPERKKKISGTQMDSLEKELQRTGVGVDAVKERYQIDSMETMSEETYRKVMSALAKTDSKVA